MSNPSSESPKETFYFFDKLIRRGGLSCLKKEFADTYEVGGSSNVVYNPDINSVEGIHHNVRTGEWEDISISFDEHVFYRLKPEFDKLIARLDEDYRRKDSEEGAELVGRYYLNQLRRLKEGLSRYDEDEGREMVRKCLDRISEEVLRRGPEALSSEYFGGDELLERYPPLSELEDSNFKYAKEHVLWARKEWPAEVGENVPYGQQGPQLARIRTAFQEKFGTEPPSARQLRRWLGLKRS